MAQNMLAVAVSEALYLRVVNFLQEQKLERSPTDAISMLIEYGLNNVGYQQTTEELFAEKDNEVEDEPLEKLQGQIGYAWKGVFIPDGTLLRMEYQGKQYFAKVEGEEILYNQVSLSPNQFATMIVGSNPNVRQPNVNAWKYLWLKRPGDKNWIFAKSLRAKKK